MDDISLYIDYIIVSSFCTPVSSFSLPLHLSIPLYRLLRWVKIQRKSGSILLDNQQHVISGAVNNGLQTGLAETIFLKPTAPYWYLYALFFIFLITPTFSNTKIAVCYLIGAIIGKFFFLSGGGRYGIYALSVVLQDEVWFVSGMVLCIFSVNVSNKAKKVWLLV